MMAAISVFWSRWQKKLAGYWRSSCRPWLTRRNIPYFVLLALVAGLVYTSLPRRPPAGEADPAGEAAALGGAEDSAPFSLARSAAELAADWDRLVRESTRDGEDSASSAAASPVFIPPRGRVAGGRGWRKAESGAWIYHAGVDLAVGAGESAYALAGGRVVSIAPHEEGGSLVEVDHGGGWRFLYGRLERVAVDIGAVVAAREILGWPREGLLHLETWRDGKALDPAAVPGLAI